MDGRGLPLSLLLTAGQAGDNPQLLPVLDAICVPRRGPGRPRSRPVQVLADKAYSHPSTRAGLRRQRNTVERCFNRLKQWRGLATRYDKTAVNYRGGLILAAVVLWIRECDSGDTP